MYQCRYLPFHSNHTEYCEAIPDGVNCDQSHGSVPTLPGFADSPEEEGGAAGFIILGMLIGATATALGLVIWTRYCSDRESGSTKEDATIVPPDTPGGTSSNAGFEQLDAAALEAAAGEGKEYDAP